MLVDRALKFRTLWQAVSDVEPPDLKTFVRWCLGCADDAIVEKVILKTSAKFENRAAHPERTHRFATRLLRNMLEDQRTLAQKGLQKMTTNKQENHDEIDIEKLIDALRQMPPSATSELAQHLLKSGRITATSTLADLHAAVDEHWSAAR